MIGIDIVEVERMAHSAENEAFVRKVFTLEEIRYYEEGGKSVQTLAGMFAAKEAIVKAIGTGFAGIDYLDVEIRHSLGGKPEAVLFRGARSLLGARKVEISISHEKRYAVASALLTDEKA
ncbi:MAG: holo-ACP synthase [Clostridiales bacterium]|jgi:phosphopantetheine--protein transferase-like protein|nr:holo-ACP synthase [Clostridiales bacterium]